MVIAKLVGAAIAGVGAVVCHKKMDEEFGKHTAGVVSNKALGWCVATGTCAAVASRLVGSAFGDFLVGSFKLEPSATEE